MTGIVIAGVAHSHVQYVLTELDHRSDLTLLGVFDPDAEAAERLAASRGVPAFADLDELLALDARIVACAGVYSERAAIVIAALRSGADVLCDKPLCISEGERREIAAAVTETGGCISLMLEKRGYPETLALMGALSAGRVGTPVAVSTWAPHKLLRESRDVWFLDPATYGGILGDLLVHDVDLALRITGAERGTVRGWTGREMDSGFALNGGAVVTFTTPGSPRLVAEVDWLTPAGSDVHGDYRLRLVGTEGTMELFWGRGYAESTSASEARHAASLPEGFRPGELALDALNGERAAARDATHEALLVTKIALLAERSARSGGIELEWKADR